MNKTKVPDGDYVIGAIKYPKPTREILIFLSDREYDNLINIELKCAIKRGRTHFSDDIILSMLIRDVDFRIKNIKYRHCDC